MVTYFCDSDCDINLEDAQRLGFRLISMPYTIEGEEIFPYESFKEFNSKEFYNRLRDGLVPKTSGLSPNKYREYFEEEFKKGNDIFYAHFSSKMSSTFNAMNIAVEELKEEYPERKFYAYDLKSITCLARALLVEISKLIKEGKTPEEIIDHSNKNLINSFALFAFANDLNFFKRSGRLNGLSAALGSLINAKPIISIDNEGSMNAIGKEIGKKNAIKKIVKNIQAIGEDVEKYPVYICHSDCLELVEEIEKVLLAEVNPNLNFEVIDINPTAGVHCGPTCLGVVFHSKSRTL